MQLNGITLSYGFLLDFADSYKLQMDLERKKREELEMEVLQLRGEQCCNTSSPFTRNDTDSFPVLLW